MLLPHSSPLLEGTFLARYDRFIARVRLGDQEVDAHCVNTGRMEGMLRPGARAWVSLAPPERKRKLLYTLELLEVDGLISGANTQTPNRLAEALIRARLIPGLRRFRELRREVPYGHRSRIDFLLTQGQRRHFVEVKNCHLVYPDGGAYFPDSVSKRAAGHLLELGEQVRGGDKATVLFVVQRNDARVLKPSDFHDPAFARAARDARAAGVRFRAVAIQPDRDGFHFAGLLPVSLAAGDPRYLEACALERQPYSGWRRRGRQHAEGEDATARGSGADD